MSQLEVVPGSVFTSTCNADNRSVTTDQRRLKTTESKKSLLPGGSIPGLLAAGAWELPRQALAAGLLAVSYFAIVLASMRISFELPGWVWGNAVAGWSGYFSMLGFEDTALVMLMAIGMIVMALNLRRAPMRRGPLLIAAGTVFAIQFLLYARLEAIWLTSIAVCIILASFSILAALLPVREPS